jgi:uncharacterized membrane protein YfcA
MSPVFQAIFGFLCGCFIGVLSGFLGIGGGGILAPMLVFGLGYSQHRAQGVSLAALLPPVGLPAVLSYRRSGTPISTKLVVLLIAGFLGGGFVGAVVAHRIPATQLRRLFATFLLLSALRALAGPKVDDADANSPPSASRLLTGLPIGLAAGVLSGLLGLGGGIVTLPLLERWTKLSRLQAQATTLAMMLPPIALPAVLVYAREQEGIPVRVAAALATGFAAGGALGATCAKRATPKMATRVYVALMVVVAAVLFAKR